MNQAMSRTSERSSADPIQKPGTTLERALQRLKAGDVTVLRLDTKGDIVLVGRGHVQSAMLTRRDGLPLADIEHPLVRFRAGEALERELVRLFAETGDVRFFELSARGGVGLDRVLVVNDITEAQKLAVANKVLCETDWLTGVANLRFLQDRVTAALIQGRPTNDRVAVLAVSLDGFSQLAKMSSADLKTMILREVAKRLQAVTREDEVVAYLGTDQFAVLMQQVSGTTDAIAAAERIRRAVNAPMRFGQREIRISASIGVAANGRRAEDADMLLANAQTALIAAREQGENDWALFDDALRTRALNSMRAEEMVDDALRTDSFVVDFQPIFHASGRTTVGFETLARIRRTSGAPIPPGSFIDAAERSGRIVPIDRRILDLACDQAKRLEELKAGNFTVSVNLSWHTALRPDLYAIVAEAIEEHRIPSSALVLEFREEALIQSSTAMHAAFAELADDGVTLAYDGCGRGRLSLPFVGAMPIKAAKLHASFVQGVVNSATDRALVRSKIASAHALGMSVTGCGVETEEQAAILSELGCDHLQGFYFGKPMSAPDAEALLQ